MDTLRHAWAVLGLSEGSSVESVRTRYRVLAKQWHPDRFSNDPQGQTEAAVQMRVLNGAYRQLMESAAAAAVSSEPTLGSTGPAAPQRGRLSREELDRMVASIGTVSPIDMLVDALPYGRANESLWQWISTMSPGNQWAITDSAAAGLAFLIGCVVMAVIEWRGGDALNSPGWYLVYAAPIIVLVLRHRRG